MTHALLNPRARGIIGVRADSRDPNAILEDLQRAFNAFREKNDERITGVENRFDDVINREHLERINADVTALQNAMNEANEALAAAQIGAAGADDLTPQQRQHRDLFNQWFRRGGESVENQLRELEVNNAMRTNSDPDGGLLVTDEVDDRIVELLRTVSAMRRLATVRSVGGAIFKRLVNRQGTTGGWVGETDARPQTNTGTLSELSYPTHEVYANPAATNGMLEDAMLDIAMWLASEVNQTFADLESAAFINGNGVNQPLGFLQETKVANSSYAWGKLGYIVSGKSAAFADSNPADALIDLAQALRAGYRSNARWLMNDLTTAEIRKIKDGTGNYIWQPSLAAGVPATLLGYGSETDDNMPDIGSNSYSIAFGDFRAGYLITDRRGTQVLRDPFTNKPYVHFYTTKRVGGGTANFEAIKLMKFGTS